MDNTPGRRETRVVKSHTEGTHVAHGDVEGAAPMKQGKYSFTPSRIKILYRWRAAIGWQLDNIEISGPWGVDADKMATQYGRVFLFVDMDNARINLSREFGEILSMESAPGWAQAFADANMPAILQESG